MHARDFKIPVQRLDKKTGAAVVHVQIQFMRSGKRTRGLAAVCVGSELLSWPPARHGWTKSPFAATIIPVGCMHVLLFLEDEDGQLMHSLKNRTGQ